MRALILIATLTAALFSLSASVSASSCITNCWRDNGGGQHCYTTCN